MSFLLLLVAGVFLSLVFLVRRAGSSSLAKSSARQVVASFGTGKYLKGKTALVTGGNAGIGLETCKALADAGCRVLLCSRSLEAAQKALDTEIKQDGLGGYTVTDDSGIVLKKLDLENLDSVRDFAAEVLSTEKDGIDFLILNAGIMSLPTLQRTKAGWERQLAVNHFGHALLTKRLLPLLVNQQRPARVIVLASTAHRFASSNPIKDPIYAKKKYVPWGAYGDSKMANLLWAKGLALDLEKNGLTRITAVSVHPGVIKTALWNQSPVNRLFSLFVGDRDVPQGAASTVWAAVCPRVAEPDMRGAYISDCGPAKPNALALSDEARDEVWRITEEELARVGN